jgi:23S rRNA (guanosine2251-2'-O)-methyltransferase
MNQKLKNEALGRLSAAEFKGSEKNKIILVLDNVRSLHNVGSVFRTADAFLIEEIILCGLTGTPPHKEIEKTALGATATVDWSYVETTAEALVILKQKRYKIFAVEQTEKSVPLQKFEMKAQPMALVFGNEVYGVEQAVIDGCDGVIEIPQLGSKHSFNISVSAGIVLWELLKYRF